MDISGDDEKLVALAAQWNAYFSVLTNSIPFVTFPILGYISDRIGRKVRASHRIVRRSSRSYALCVHRRVA